MAQLMTYRKKELVSFLVSMAGQNALITIINVSLAYFLQFTILIPALVVSIVMTIARFWDAFNDLLMGTFVDRTNSPRGKCIPYLRWVPIPIALLTIACFTSLGIFGDGGFKDFAIVAFAAFAYLAWDTFYTIGDIPLWSLPARMTESEHDRNRMISYARVTGAIGSIGAMFIFQPASFAIGERISAIANVSPAEGERWGFFTVAVLFSIIGGLMFLIVGHTAKERIAVTPEKTSFKKNMLIMWNNRPYRQIIISGILSSPRNLLMVVIMPLISYYYASKDPLSAILYLVLLGGVTFIGQFGAMLVAPRLVKNISKKRLYNTSNLISVPPFLMLFMLYLIFPQSMTEPALLAVTSFILLFVGISLGLSIVLITMMIPDTMDLEEHQTGHRPDGAFMSGLTFFGKLQGGIAAIISGIAYTIVGFSDQRVAEVNDFITAGGIPRLESQYQPFMTVLFFLMTIVPAIGSILAVIPTWRYALDDKDHKKILGELNRKRSIDRGE